MASSRSVLATLSNQQMGDQHWRCQFYDQVFDRIQAENLGRNSLRRFSTNKRSSTARSEEAATNLRYTPEGGFNQPRLPLRRRRHSRASTELGGQAHQFTNAVHEQNRTDRVNDAYPRERRRRSSVTTMNTLSAAEFLSFQIEDEAPRFRGVPDPLPCEQCPSLFSGRDRITNRQRHVRENHQGAPWHPCPDCNKTFRRQSSVKRHRKVHHQGQV